MLLIGQRVVTLIPALFKSPSILLCDFVTLYIHILNVLCCNCPFFLVTMVEQFVGKWKMTSSDNFDEYMKAVGKTNSIIYNNVCITMFFFMHLYQKATFCPVVGLLQSCTCCNTSNVIFCIAGCRCWFCLSANG